MSNNKNNDLSNNNNDLSYNKPVDVSYDNKKLILEVGNKWHLDKNRIKDGKKVDKGFIYSSGNNSEWMMKEQLQNFLKSPQYLELQELNI